MFSFVTIYTAVTLYIQSISYVDNREFTGVDGVLPPKPIGYQAFIYSKAITVIATIVFLMNNSLADGLLVGPVLDSVAQVSNVGRSSSSIVATSFIPGTAGQSPSHA